MYTWPFCQETQSTVTIYLLEHYCRRVVGSGGYLSNHIVFSTWQTASPNCFSTSEKISLRHLSPLSHRNYFLASKNGLTSALVDQQKIMSRWFGHIPILIMRVWLYVHQRRVFICRSSSQEARPIGGYFSSYVAISRLTNHVLKFLSKCDGISYQHLSLFSHRSYSLAIWESINIRTFQTAMKTLSHWSDPFPILIVRLLLHVDLRWTLIRRSSWPSNDLRSGRLSSVANFCLSFTGFSGLPTKFNLDYFALFQWRSTSRLSILRLDHRHLGLIIRL